MLHPLLERQLRKAGLRGEVLPPNLEAWSQFLHRASASYTEADRNRYTIERSLEISSAEMQALHSTLAEERDHLRAVVRSVGEGLCVLDAEGRVLSLNAEAERLLGWKEEEGRGKPILEWIEGRDEANPGGRSPRWEELVEERTIQSGVGRFAPRERTPFSASYVLAPIVRDGALRGAVLVFRDVTSERRAEESLRHSKEAAEAASRAKSEFLANISHEIRTPLNGVIGILDLLLDETLDPRAREYAEIARRSAEALLRVLGDVLDFSKIEAGRMELESDDFDLRELLEGVADGLAARAEEKGLELVCGLRPGGPRLLRGDAARLRQILLNLGGNAVKFTERGEVVLLAETEVRPDGRVEVRISVRDTGIGIDEVQQERLFHPFSQGDGSSTRRHGGTGLGLAISRRLAELMGGTIGLASRRGAGSTFLARLLLEPSGAVSPPPPASLAGRRVLVLDDPPSARDFLAEQVRAAGAQVEATSTGSEALSLVRAALASGRPFDAIVLDRHLSGEDGIALAEAIRAAGGGSPPHPFLLLPLRARREEVAGRSFGILTKPAKASLLLSTLADAPAVARRAPPGGTGRGHGAGPRVLLVEDDPVNRLVATALLRRIGIEPALASNGREAVEAFARETFDLVLMDVQMPELDGREATVAIRAAEAPGQRVPIVAVTAHATKEDRERCLASGMDDYLTKPIRGEDLARAIGRWTGARSPA
ncbi:MAG: response regulator [Planctomycetes bacterium]|nr:response regulator [Planctomycetota bacterium]